MIEEHQLYDWQKEFLQKYKGEGVVKAFPGTGKTDAVIHLIKQRDVKPVIIAVPTTSLRKQWEERIKEYNIQDNIKSIYTFSKASKDGFHDTCNLLVVDECHRATSQKFKKLFSNIYHTQILGLTATPNEEVEKLMGKIIINLSYNQSKQYLADFTVYFHLIDLLPHEKELYDFYTEKIRNIYRRYGRRLTKIANLELKNNILQRRNVVYWAENRIPKTIEIYNQNPDLTTLIITQRIEQAEIISKELNIPVFHSKKPDYALLKDFQENRIKSLVSVQMLKEGFDKKDIQRLILTSTFITEQYFVQTLGRAVRLPEDAQIHVLLARGTTDINLLSKYRKMFNSVVVR